MLLHRSPLIEDTRTPLANNRSVGKRPPNSNLSFMDATERHAGTDKLSPLSMTQSRCDSGPAPSAAPVSRSSGATGGSGHEKEQPSYTKSTAALGDGNPVPNNLVVRFLLAIKHIFLSSIVNVLLVFVLAGVAVRRLTSVYPYYPFQTHDTKPLI